jgi:chemotaxis protein MotB
MTTYSDLMTQILIFFVMLFALASALNELQLIELKRRLEGYVVENNLEDAVGLRIDEKGLVISLREKYMFDSGKAEIYPEAKIILEEIVKECLTVPNNMNVEGHTDNVPIHTSEFPSNWELSAARATNVTRYLVEKLEFPPKRIASGGYGEYHPVATNDTPDGRAKNRRVDVIVRRLPSGSAVTVPAGTSR